MMEKIENFVSKETEKLRAKAFILSVRAREAAGVVQQFGNAVVEGKQLISAGDINMMVYRLNYYADWLERISAGEEVAEDDLSKMEEIIASIRIPKKNKYKRGIIEVIYVGENSSGRATRHKLYEMKTDNEPLQGDDIEMKFRVGQNGYGKRLAKRV
jgi:hypothetical protein